MRACAEAWDLWLRPILVIRLIMKPDIAYRGVVGSSLQDSDAPYTITERQHPRPKTLIAGPDPRSPKPPEDYTLVVALRVIEKAGMSSPRRPVRGHGIYGCGSAVPCLYLVYA